MTLDLTYLRREPAELIAYLPNVELVGDRTVRFAGNIIEINMFLEMACSYSP